MKFVNKALAFMIFSLCFCSFAFASEDSPSPFPDDFYISDLPDLPPLDDSTTENLGNAPTTPVNEAGSVPPPPSSDAVLPVENPLIENNTEFPSTNVGKTVFASESSEPKPIFQKSAQSTATQPSIVSSNQSLTETLKNNNKNTFIEGTWVEKLTSMNPMSVFASSGKKEPESDDESLTDLVKSSRSKNSNGKSNASVFDISGVMLKMTLNQVERTLTNRGFQKVNAEYTIPNFIKWRNEEECQSQGIVGYERLQSCIKTLSRKAGHEYIFHIKYAKFDSKEEIDVYFTSNFTENKVHKIEYKSKIAAVTGNSPKAVYIRNLKIYDFWKKINQKFGTPDNKKNVTWGMGGNKPFLKASTGYLLLDDPMFREMDYTRMSREDKRFIHSDYYNF